MDAIKEINRRSTNNKKGYSTTLHQVHLKFFLLMLTIAFSMPLFSGFLIE
jgi:hypothetical protein